MINREELRNNRKACPSCGSREVTRSHRRGIAERYVLPTVRIRPYRCAACDRRFYGLERSQAVEQSAEEKLTQTV
jgi:DNA-directed RNA polymerase subunit RPC12/RpoP